MIRIWDVASTRELGPIQAHQFFVSAVALSPDGSTVASGSFQTIYLWQAGTGKELRRLEGHQGMVCSLAFSPDGKTLVSGGLDHTASLWDVATGRQLRQWEKHGRPVMVVAFSPDGKSVASGSQDGRICFWDRTTGQELRHFQVPETGFHSIIFSPDGKMIADVIAPTAQLSLWDLTEGKEIHQPERREEGIHSVAFSPNGKVLAFGSADHRGVRLLATATGRELGQLGEASSRTTASLCFSPDGRSLASGAGDGTIRLWEVSTRKDRCQLKGHQGIVGSVAFSTDGQRMVSGSGDTTVLVWDMTGGLRDRRVSLSSQEQEAAWACLAAEDAAAANQAIWRLIAASDQTVQLVKKRLRPVAVVEKQQLTRLVAQLDSDQFAVRDRACRQLEEFGDPAIPILRETLAGKPSFEVRRRVEELLQKLDGPVPSPGQLCDLRVVEVLEHIGTPEARGVLQKLANGAPEARLTQEAKASLERLAKRP